MEFEKYQKVLLSNPTRNSKDVARFLNLEPDNLARVQMFNGDFKTVPVEALETFDENLHKTATAESFVYSNSPRQHGKTAMAGLFNKNRESSKSEREMLLDEAKEIVSNDRATVYGKPENNFARIANLWNTYLQDKEDITPADVAAMMILLKIARVSNTIDHHDSWLDIAGYAACGWESALGT